MHNRESIQTILNDSAVGVYVVNEDCTVHAWNDKVINILEVNPSELSDSKCIWERDGRCDLNLYCNLKRNYSTPKKLVIDYPVDDKRTKKIEVHMEKVQVGNADDLSVIYIKELDFPLILDTSQVNLINTWQAILEASPDGIVLVSLDGRIQFVSDRMIEMLGFSIDMRSQVIGKWLIDFVQPEDEKNITENLWKQLSGVSINYINEYTLLKHDGTFVTIEATTSTINDDFGRPNNILMIARDVTKRNRVDKKLAVSEFKYSAIFDSSPIAIGVFERDGSPRKVNGAFLSLLQIELTQDIKSLISVENWIEKQHFLTEGDSDQEVRFHELVKLTDDEIMLEISVKPIVYEDDRPFYIIQAVDITKQHFTMKNIEYNSLHDELTGLHNRRFYNAIIEEINVFQNYPLSVVMADVNGLKIINDAFGHRYGDELLKTVGSILKKQLRENDIIARVGGDEFIILLPNTRMDQATKTVNRIVGEASQTQIGSFPISISFGVATKVDAFTEFAEVISESEQNMYKEKQLKSPLFKRWIIDHFSEEIRQNNDQMTDYLDGIRKALNEVAQHLEWQRVDIDVLNEMCKYTEIGLVTMENFNPDDFFRWQFYETGFLYRYSDVSAQLLLLVPELSYLAQHVKGISRRWHDSDMELVTENDRISRQGCLYRIVRDYLWICNVKTPEYAEAYFNEDASDKYDPKMKEIVLRLAKENRWGY